VATVNEANAGVDALNDWIETYVTGWGSDTVKARFTPSLRLNLVLEILGAAERARKPPPKG